MQLERSTHRWPLALIVVALVCATTVGCVRRRLTVRSDPPGALVYVDEREIGTTPVSTPFTYYGTRKLQLVKDGYETVTVMQRFDPPWYQWPGIDFFAENVWPREERDERALDFQMVPQKIVPTDEILSRAENLRTSLQQGYVAPVPARPSGVVGPPIDSGVGPPLRPPVRPPVGPPTGPPMREILPPPQ